MNLEQLKYPIGRFNYGKTYTIAETETAIKEIRALPVRLEQLILTTPEDKLGQSYRSGGWNGRQIINHLCDVYINAYLRSKWLLTEDNPVIKTYDQNAFAGLPDNDYAINTSQKLLSNLIQKWAFLLSSIPETDYKRTLTHPDLERPIPLDELIVMYAWHGNHHFAHLEIISNTPTGL